MSPHGPVIRPLDVALAGGVAVIATLGQSELVAEPLDGLGYGLLALGAAALVVHRVWPLAAFAVALAAQLSYLLLGYPEAIEWLATAVALGSVAYGLGPRSAVPLAVLCVALSASDIVDRGLAAVDAEALLVVVGLGGAVVVGTSLRTRHEYLRAVEERAAMAERSRVNEARRLVGEERLRIAREVHDVVWGDPASELHVIRRSLCDGGRLYLCYQPLDRTALDSTVDRLVERLSASGYAVHDALTGTPPSGPMLREEFGLRHATGPLHAARDVGDGRR